MLIHELTADECRAILRRTRLARLACQREGQPYVVPVHLSYDSDWHCLYGFSTVGQKINWMRQSPKVCVEFDDIADPNHWVTIVAFGVYEEIGDDDLGRGARERARRFFEDRQEWWLPAAARTPAHEPPAIVVYRIQISRMTGRRAARDRP
jgi:uncharacterized protein